MHGWKTVHTKGNVNESSTIPSMDNYKDAVG